jgi:outer membrane protein
MNSLKTFFLLLLVAVFLFPGIMQAQETGIKSPTQFSLKQAQEYALLNNRTVKNSRIDTELAKKKIWETTAIGLPQVSASANYQHIFKVPTINFSGTQISTEYIPFDFNTHLGTTSSVPDGNGGTIYLNTVPGADIALGVPNNLSLDINLSQIIFSGAYLVGLQASKVYYQMSDQGLEKSEIDVRETIANTYFLILDLEQNEKIVAQSYENINKTLSDMREMLKMGFIENTDVDQIELTSSNLSNALKTLGRQVDASRDLLKFQLGLPFENAIELTDDLNSTLTGITLETIEGRQMNLENNITYKIMSTQEKLGELNLKREQSGYLPSIAAFYKHSEKIKKADFDFTMKDIAGVSMSIPIFSSGQRNAMVAERKLELEKIRNSKELAIDGLKLEYINARNEFRTSYEKYLNEKHNVELASKIYDKITIKYKEGLSGSLDLTTAQNQYLTAQSNYFTAAYTLLAAKNKLDKLTNNQ